MTRRVKDLFVGVGSLIFGAFCLLMTLVDQHRRKHHQ